MVAIKNGHPSVTIVYLLFSILGAILAEALYTSRGSEVPSTNIFCLEQILRAQLLIIDCWLKIKPQIIKLILAIPI
jgi:hypothetical protein